MGDYLLRLAIVLPIVCALAWGSLVMWKRFHGGMPSRDRAERSVAIVDVVSMGPSGKIVAVSFAGRMLLLSASRGRIALLAEAQPESPDA